MTKNATSAASDTAPDHPKGPGEVTLADIKQHPRYYIAGPGRTAAGRSYCEHRYRLTASCPLCP